MWLAADEYGEYLFFYNKPIRFRGSWYTGNPYETTSVELAEGETLRLIGRTLTWEDEPVEYTEEMMEGKDEEFANAKKFIGL